MRLRTTCLLLCALLAGCAVGPNFRRPETHEPAVLRGQAAPEERSLADLAWWNLYHDPALTALVEASLAEGYDARIAASRVEQARAIETQTHGQLLPSLGYAGSAYRGKNALEGTPYPSGGTSSDAFNGYLAAAWEPDIWGKLRRLDEAARAQYLESEEVRRGVRLSLVGEVATDYFQLLELDEELAISREAADSFGQSLRLFNQRLRGGIASKLETSSAQADQAAAEARIPEIERETAILEDQLGVLLGRNPGPIARATRLSNHSPAPEAPAGIPSALLERRPDVRAAEYAARAANAQIGATIESFLPRIGLSAVFGGLSERLQSITSRQAGLWSVGAQVSGPLFQGGTLRGQ
jgi:multidrug efflux system outer membrane protein